MPTKFMQATITGVAQSAVWATAPNVGVPYKWTATLNVTAQAHSDSTVGNGGAGLFFNAKDVAVGDWIASSGGARALKISAISGTATSSQVSVTLEDENLYNALSDSSGNRDGLIPTGVGNKAYIFAVTNGLPVLSPLPDALPGNLPSTFIPSITGRFSSTGGAGNVVKNTTLTVGTGAGSVDHEVIFDNGGSTKPRIRWNHLTGKLTFSHDGVAFSDIGSGGLAWTKINSTTTAVVGNGYVLDPATAAFNVTLPLSPADGATVAFSTTSNILTNAVVIQRNGATIQDTAEDMTVNSKAKFSLVYTSGSWRIV
jgi:hypothetical protein